MKIRTIYEKCVQIAKFTNCTLFFHQMYAIGLKFAVPLHHQTTTNTVLSAFDVAEKSKTKTNFQK